MVMKNLKFTIYTAFLGNIGKNIRALAYDFTESEIIIYGYLDCTPNDMDYESIDMAITEIISSYPNFTSQNIILSESYEPIGKLPFYKGWIFARKE
ncbi:hypothetical protein IA938_01555 [Listeria welshimeri]|nr:hypothetical protein [Listeria welshimeri]MBC1346249.1 hypothetical protein [Listeria welshimeri]MBC1355839.1 hypothetical protein [Listeria welshimeri]MBC1465785.1 hypothetical protein [Listeria welshimeri]MBC1467624.1 hypothetical protein [Listeria welshimeri]